jgi:FlaG/FlaF family flagellin (archaellin)
MKQFREHAVSPVVGIMLMLVVTIIIAAVVSGFAGGLVSGHQKTPIATVSGTFSDSQGMTFTNAGGDAIPAQHMVVTIQPDDTFGQGLMATSAQVVLPSIIMDTNGNLLENPDGTSNITAFVPGQTLYINASMLNPSILQPAIAPSDSANITQVGTQWTYVGFHPDFWALCFVNPNNVGKSFTLTLLDKATGGTIAKSTVYITP